MSQIKIGIIEDEVLIADHLAALLTKLNYKINFVVTNAQDALAALNDTDLLLIDIKIKGDLDGIDLANTVKRKHNIPYIFITSNSDDATVERAKQTNPSGFLVKPFKNRDVEIAIDLALHNHATYVQHLYKSANNYKHFFVKDKLAWVKLIFENILYIQAADNYVIVHFNNDQLVITKSLKFFEDNLPLYFLRVHKSYIVNTNHIEKIVDKEILIGHQHIAITDTYKQSLYDFLGI